MWRPTEAEAALLSTGEAIVYGHDGICEVVRLDALPKELATYVRQTERDEARKAAKEALRKSAPRGVKVSKSMWRKVLGAQAKGRLCER